MIRSRFRIPVLVALLSPIFTGCDANLPSAPASAVTLDRTSSHAVSRPRLAVCPTNSTETVSGEIGAAGGSLELAGHRLTIPNGALTAPARFTLQAPAGRVLLVTVSAQGNEPIRFSAPAAVTISYERCKRQNLTSGSTAVWSIEAQSDGGVTSLDGESDPVHETITVLVDLSSEGDELFVARGIYAVAY